MARPPAAAEALARAPAGASASTSSARASHCRPCHLDEDAAAGGARPGPVHGGPEVVLLGGQTGQPCRLVGARELGLGPVHQVGEEVEMATPVLDDLAGVDQLLLGVLADALEQAVAGGAVLLLDDHEAAGHEMVQEVEDVEGIDAVAGRHRLCRLERPPAAEDGQPPQKHALVLGQQLVAPVDGGPQRLLAGHGRAVAAGEEAELVAETVEDLAGGEHVHARGGQLDGQRDAVEAPADVLDDSAVRVARVELPVPRAGPVDEQLHALSRHHGRDAEHDLAGNAERLLAGGHHLQAAAGLQQEGDELRARGQDVLAVVEDQQQGLGGEGLGEGRVEVATALLSDAERRGDHVRKLGGVRHRRQLHQPDPVGEPVDRLGRHLHGQARLARAP